MKKTLLTVTMITIIVLALSSTTFAFGGFEGCGQRGDRPRDSLSEEEQSHFEKIIEQFQNKMLELRGKMLDFRKNGDDEGIQAMREERFKLMEKKRAAIGDAFPELAERSQTFDNEKGNWCGRNGDGFNR